MSLQFVKASTSDALTLNGISKRAFDSDGGDVVIDKNRIIIRDKFLFRSIRFI